MLLFWVSYLDSCLLAHHPLFGCYLPGITLYILYFTLYFEGLSYPFQYKYSVNPTIFYLFWPMFWGSILGVSIVKSGKSKKEKIQKRENPKIRKSKKEKNKKIQKEKKKRRKKKFYLIYA